jgi:cytochrome d ubiquinol oxidase subunit I
LNVLDIARWQFAITTVYHFVLVPLTIGLAILVAGMQTAWVRTGNPRYRAMTRFWGRILLINFALGVATGIVQEFQFGMAWSDYSRFVGDVFGAPLAMEGLIAFFVESTFLGLWIFGWDRLSKRVHLACIWAAALATNISAYFILAANSWMQHPVGVELVDGKPRLTDIWAVLGNSTVLATFPHTLAGAFAVAGTVLVGISAWRLWQARTDGPVFRSSLKLGAWVGVVAFVAVALSGDAQAKLMFQQQPMKMAAAEALCHTEQPAGFSVFAVGDVAQPNCESVKSIELPGLLSFLANSDTGSKVTGVTDLVAQYRAKYGATYPDGTAVDYVPMLPVTYWAFRLMIGFGLVAAAGCALALWLIRRGRSPGRWFARLALLGIATPFLANALGWIFTEMGRQPFVVAPNPSGVDGVWMFTAQAVSGKVTVGEALTSVIVLTLVYGVLAAVEAVLVVRAARKPVELAEPDDTSSSDVFTFAY